VKVRAHCCDVIRGKVGRGWAGGDCRQGRAKAGGVRCGNRGARQRPHFRARPDDAETYGQRERGGQTNVTKQKKDLTYSNGSGVCLARSGTLSGHTRDVQCREGKKETGAEISSSCRWGRAGQRLGARVGRPVR
jgi:hypothetical protein